MKGIFLLFLSWGLFIWGEFVTSRRVSLSTKPSFTTIVFMHKHLSQKRQELTTLNFLLKYPLLVAFAPGLLLSVSFCGLERVWGNFSTHTKWHQMIADICQKHNDDVSRFELLLVSS